MHFKDSLSKMGLIGLGVISFSLIFVGCGRWTNDKPKDDSPTMIELETNQCLEKIPETIEKYLNQKLSPSMLHESMDCVDRTLVEFLRSTQGVDNSSYLSSELQKFFQKYIFKKTISNDFLDGIMRLKVSILGGNTSQMTRSEFEHFRRLLPLFENELGRLAPYINYYAMNDSIVKTLDHEEQKSQMSLAIEALKQTARNLIPALELGASDYSIQEFRKLIINVDEFITDESGAHPLSLWHDNLRTLEKVKDLLVGIYDGSRTNYQILNLTEVLIEVYGVCVEYHFLSSNFNVQNPTQLLETTNWIEKIFSVIQQSLDQRVTKSIPYSDIDELMDELSLRGYLPKHLKVTTIKSTYRQFLIRFFDPVQGDNLEVFTEYHLREIHRLFQGFQLIQLGISRLFIDGNSRSLSEIKTIFDQFPLKEEIKKIAPYSVVEQEMLMRVWQHFQELVSHSINRHWDLDGRYFVSNKKNEKFTFHELTRLNLFRLFSSLLMNGYKPQKGIEAKNKNLTIHEIKIFLDEFRSLGDDLKIFDLRQDDSAPRIAREADLFSPSANGDELIQYNELLDLIAILWSGGVVVLDRFKDVAQIEKCPIEVIDYFRKPYLKTDCASHVLRKNFSIIFSHLSQLSSYVNRLNDQQWESFFKDLLIIGKTCSDDHKGLETGDQRTMIVVLHYIESLFSIYDSDEDGFLKNNELDKAFPRFDRFITDMTKVRMKTSNPKTYAVLDTLGYNWSDLGNRVFKFIVFNGRSPNDDEATDLVWGGDSESQKQLKRADRHSIVRVFSALKTELSPGVVNCGVFSIE